MAVSPDVLPPSAGELLRLLRATLAGRSPAPDTDWQAALSQAAWHGVDAFLYPTLAGLPAGEQPPAGVLAPWRRQFLSAAADAVRREAQAQELLAALAQAQVCAVPLKGLWLAAHLYADPGQRRMDDLDILVPPSDLPRAREVLRRLGYEPHGIIASPALDSDQGYTCPRHAWPLELHWRLGVPNQPPLHCPEIPGLWQRLVPEMLLDAPVRALCPEEHLVYLAYHVLHHRFALPLRSYLDLALLVRRLGDSCNRTQLDAIAAEWGLADATPRILALASELFDQPLPAAFAGWSAPAEQPQRARAVRTILAPATLQQLPAERTLQEFRKRAPLARLGLLLRRIFQTQEFLRREYPCARRRIGLPLAYALRARDLLRRNAGLVRRVLQHEPAVAQQLDMAAAREQLLNWTLGRRDA